MSKKKIIIILVIVALGAGLFLFKIGGNKNNTDTEMVNTGDSGLANDFIKALMGVENVALDTSLLKSPVFQSLVASGAYVDPNPNRGKTDPFSVISGTEVLPPDGPENSPRVIGGVQSGEVIPISYPEIKVSKITTTTAYISVIGIPKNNKVSVSVSGSNNVTIPELNLAYKNETSEYAAVITGLSTKTKYSASLQAPNSYAGLQADFTTK